MGDALSIDFGSSTLGICLILVLLFALSVWLFLGIALVCDEYLCPSLEKISEELQVPASVSAATFLAFGSSAPELIISLAGAASNNTETTIPTLLASALIAFGAIPAVAIILINRAEIRLDARTVLRDATAVFSALIILAYYSTRRTINLLQAILLALTYPIYVFIVYYLHEDEHHALHSPEEERLVSDDCPSRESSGIASKKVTPDTNDELSQSDASCNYSQCCWNCCARIVGTLQIPFRSLSQMIVCGGHKQQFFSMLLVLSVLSYIAVILASYIAKFSNMSRATAGMTILALGAQVPDTISAYELTKNGQPDAAISQAVASQVINLTFGLGVPFFGTCLYQGHGVRTTNNGTILNISILLAFMILIYILIFLSHLEARPRLTSIVSRNHGWTFLFAFLLVYGLSIITAELSWPEIRF